MGEKKKILKIEKIMKLKIKMIIKLMIKIESQINKKKIMEMISMKLA